MRIRSPSMSELHAFATAARLGSFTRAAETLCVTQGAISRAISRLESHFGQPLIHRNAHRLTLTDAGRSYLEAIAVHLAAIETASASMLATDRRHHLTCPPSPRWPVSGWFRACRTSTVATQRSTWTSSPIGATRISRAPGRMPRSWRAKQPVAGLAGRLCDRT
jgi:hypothetical protein